LQVPVVQVAPEALAGEQGAPQVPQLVTVFSPASQPSEVTPLQLPQPPLQLEMAQVPVEQVEVALARLQVTPQTAQFEVVRRLVSQPSEVMPLQLPQPELQEEMAHVPEPQVAVALARLQVEPQLPQLVVVVSEVSQPSVRLPLQSPQPELHEA
jgi:hypothetical protein